MLDCIADDNFVGYAEYYGGETDFDYDYTLVEYETLHKIYRVDDNVYLIVSPAYYGHNKPTLEIYEDKNITRYVINGYIRPDLYDQWHTLYPDLD